KGYPIFAIPKKNKIQFALAKIQASPLAKIEYDRIRWEGIGGKRSKKNHSRKILFLTLNLMIKIKNVNNLRKIKLMANDLSKRILRYLKKNALMHNPKQLLEFMIKINPLLQPERMQ
ncbi:hypothetical protein ACP0SI_08755, partial [Campylobacter coli]